MAVKRSIEVIAPGTIVKVHRAGLSSLSATVEGVWISFGPNMRYSVAWWKDDERKTEWVEPYEVSVAVHDAKPLKIGFTVEAANG